MKISRYLYLNRIILKCIKRIYFPCIIVSLIFFQCTPSQKQFTELSPDEVGLNFRNDIVETQHTNIMTYEYTYNGAGIAAGDINSDGLTDLYFSGNSVGNKLFINKGKWHFEDITTPSQTGGRKDWKTGVTMADVNGDGLLDRIFHFTQRDTGFSCNDIPIGQSQTTVFGYLKVLGKAIAGADTLTITR